MAKSLLAIETSCDETGIALLKFDSEKIELKSSLISSQIIVHQAYGGVVPEIASREHLTALPKLFAEIVGNQTFDYVAATEGPGLKGCLLMGMGFAKAVAASRKIPYIGVNHIEGHVWSAALTETIPEGRFLSLIVSGGHTELVLVKGVGQYQVIVGTIDDAAGEAFDKSGNLLGLEYPGGAALAKLADSVSESRYKLPKVMRESEGFSFSGLKTAISLFVKRSDAALKSDPALKLELAYAVQAAIVEAIEFKVLEAIDRFDIKTLVLGGGVAANKALRTKLNNLPISVIYPQSEFCTDSAAMIGYVGCCRARRGEVSEMSSEPRPRWPLEELV